MGTRKYPEFERYLTEKAKKRTERRRNPYIRNFQKLSKASSSSNYEREKYENVTINFPSSFSIWKETAKALSTFEKTEKFLKKEKSIILNMSNIEHISEDAILYLISRLHHYRHIYPKQSVQGYFPQNQVCKDLLLKSHFQKYVNSEYKCEDNQDIFPIKDGILADGTIVDQVIEFVKDNISLEEQTAKISYGTILECLKNTKEHAYSESNAYGKWWMIAIPDKVSRKVHFTALDNGYGIPSTVKKKFREIIKTTSSKFVQSSNIDADLICSALEGDYQRSQTGKVYRGKGLPSVFELTQLSQIDNLRVISNYGHVLAGKNKIVMEAQTLEHKFEGTLISWDFTA